LPNKTFSSGGDEGAEPAGTHQHHHHQQQQQQQRQFSVGLEAVGVEWSRLSDHTPCLRAVQ